MPRRTMRVIAWRATIRLNEQIFAPNLVENKAEKVNLNTSNTIPHIILSAEGLKNPIHMMIDTGAGSNLIKQQAVKTNVKINKYECLKLTGVNELMET